MFLAWMNMSEFKWLSYEGLYTMVLKKHGEIVSAAIAEVCTPAEFLIVVVCSILFLAVVVE